MKQDTVPHAQAAARANSRPRMLLVLLYCGLVAGLMLALVWSVTSGRYQVSFSKVVAILAAHVVDITPTWTATEGVVVEVIRLPRVLMAAIAGAGLALCGAALQGIFRNPLVGPQTIGAASGAALGGVAAILFVGFGPFVQVAAFAGAALALVAVLAIHRSDSVSPILTLVLAGVVVSAFCGALVGLATYVADPETKLQDIVFWLLGSFASATWAKLQLICTLGRAISTRIAYPPAPPVRQSRPRRTGDLLAERDTALQLVRGS